MRDPRLDAFFILGQLNALISVSKIVKMNPEVTTLIKEIREAFIRFANLQESETKDE